MSFATDVDRGFMDYYFCTFTDEELTRVVFLVVVNMFYFEL
jgi:hypothetical protein